MQPETRALWGRIEPFAIGPQGASLSFADRLARENGWPRAYADRVVAEYKRFVLLAMAAEHPVTPSDQVDQAWHLHLLYTESYWSELCGQVLGRPLHHGPTRGGRNEGTKFAGWYEATLASYERIFGAPPPRDIWPTTRERFADADRFRRVNTARRWVLPRLRVSSGPLPVLLALLALGCVSVTRDSFSIENLVLGFFVALLVFGLVRLIIRAHRGGSGCSSAGGCGGAGCGSSGCGGGGCGG